MSRQQILEAISLAMIDAADRGDIRLLNRLREAADRPYIIDQLAEEFEDGEGVDTEEQEEADAEASAMNPDGNVGRDIGGRKAYDIPESEVATSDQTLGLGPWEAGELVLRRGSWSDSNGNDLPVVRVEAWDGKRFLHAEPWALEDAICPAQGAGIVAKASQYHGPNPPGPGWHMVGQGPKGGKIWEPNPGTDAEAGAGTGGKEQSDDEEEEPGGKRDFADDDIIAPNTEIVVPPESPRLIDSYNFVDADGKTQEYKVRLQKGIVYPDTDKFNQDRVVIYRWIVPQAADDAQGAWTTHRDVAIEEAYKLATNHNQAKPEKAEISSRDDAAEAELSEPPAPKAPELPEKYKPTGRTADVDASHLSPDQDDEVTRLLESLTGTHDLDELAVLVGAEDGRVTIQDVGSDFAGDGIRVAVNTDKYAATRFIGIDSKGRKFINNELLEVTKKKEGTGTALLAREVAAAQAAGFEYIACHAAGFKGDMNGYYTWPVLGFDESIESMKADNNPVWKEIVKKFPNAKSIRDVVMTQDGRDWWEENGTDLYQMRFDLKPGSWSNFMLNSYIQREEAKRQATAAEPVPVASKSAGIVTKAAQYHGPNPPGPNWALVGEGPKGGKIWEPKPGTEAEAGVAEGERAEATKPPGKRDFTDADMRGVDVEYDNNSVVDTYRDDDGKHSVHVERGLIHPAPNKFTETDKYVYRWIVYGESDDDHGAWTVDMQGAVKQAKEIAKERHEKLDFEDQDIENHDIDVLPRREIIDGYNVVTDGGYNDTAYVRLQTGVVYPDKGEFNTSGQVRVYRWIRDDTDDQDHGDWTLDRATALADGRDVAKSNSQPMAKPVQESNAGEDQEDEEDEMPDSPVEPPPPAPELPKKYTTPGGSAHVDPTRLSDADSRKAEEMLKLITGSDDIDQLASLVGAEDGTVEIRSVGTYKKRFTDDPDLRAEGIRVTVDSPKWTGTRFIGIDSNGKKFIKNELIDVKVKKQGTGTAVFGRQAAAAKAAGLDYIACHAAGNKNEYMNGYYTWPLMGFDQSISSMAKRSPKTAAKLRDKFPEAKSIRDVVMTQDGRDWWRENGSDLYKMKFDLKAGSWSNFMLNSYVEYTEAKATQKAKQAADAAKSQKRDERLQSSKERATK
jgi:hypothetical protein